MNKNYNQKYFSERESMPKYMLEEIGFILKKNGVKKVLDVGSGSGALVKYLNKKGFHAKGCDSSDEAVKISGHIRASATKLPFENESFEAVLAISLIEHLTSKQGEKFIKESFRILEPGGTLFLVTPNFNSPLRFLLQKKWFGYKDPTHVNFFTLYSLSKLLAGEKFTDIRYTHPVKPNLSFDWPIPVNVQKFPRLVKILLNFLFISTPATLLRDSLWIKAVKK